MNYFTSIIFVFLSLMSIAQNRASTSYFGTAALDFRAVPPQPIVNSGMNSLEAAASICNEQGDLLFYSNGGDSPLNPGVFGGIWNANNQLMENGDLTGLGGCVSTFFGATIIPIDTTVNKTVDNTIYYLITNDCMESNFSGNHINAGLRYSVIDMSYNGGLGKVTAKDIGILSFSGLEGVSTSWEPIAAISHANNKDYWLFGYHNDSLYSMKVGYNSFEGYQSYFKSGGRITISPKGNYLVTNGWLYELNNNTGELEVLFNLNTNNCAFSSNGMVLYAAEGLLLFQYDLASSFIQNSKFELSGLGVKEELVLAPDYKIYFYSGNTTFLNGVIACPNNVGVSCGVNQQQVSLGGKNSGTLFTNIPANLLFKEASNCILNIEENHTSSFRIYPNPAKDKFTISSDELISKVQLYNYVGQVVWERTLNASFSEIDVNDFEKGMYILRIQNDQDKVFNYRLEVQ